MDSRNEPWLAGALNTAFRRNLDIKRLYQTESRKAITNQLTNRAFDHFDILLPQTELIKIAKDFFAILQSIKRFENEEGETAELETQAQIDATQKLMSNIINIGILELLCPPNQLQNEIIATLNWHDLTSKISKIKLLCAYLGAVFGLIYAKYPTSIDEHKQARACVERFINRNCNTAVISILLERQFITKAETEGEAANEDNNFFKSRPVVAGMIAGSLAALAGLAFGIYAAVKSYNNHEDSSEEVQKSQPHSTPGKQ